MTNKSIWIDHQHAYIFEFKDNHVLEKKYLKKVDWKIHHIEQPQKFKHAMEHQRIFYKMLAIDLGSPDHLLILGSGVAMNEFKNYCESHYNENIAKKIITLISMGSPPRRSEILKTSRLYFDSIKLRGSSKDKTQSYSEINK